jgi:hypothetical protein
MDVGKAFAFVFEDQEWIVKLLIAAAILLVGILFSWLLLVPLILAIALLGGYGAEVMRRVINGQSQLPEWENWGELIVDGLKVIVIGIVYALPFIIISACLGTPLGLLNNDGANSANAAVGLLSFALSCLDIIWGIALSIILPAAIGFWIADDDLGSAFQFGKVLGFVRDNFTTYLITFLMSWVASIVGSLGVIVCGFGWFVTQPYSWLVTMHLYGQAFVEASGKASPAPAADLEDLA